MSADVTDIASGGRAALRRYASRVLTDDAPECLACGACCFSTLRRYVPVTGDDYARLGDLAPDLVVWEENRAYLRIHDGHCAALRVDAGRGELVCTVYETRPAICRELARGSPECAGERATKADRPVTALRLARRLS